MTSEAVQDHYSGDTLRVRGETVARFSVGVVGFLRVLGALLSGFWAWTLWGIWSDVRLAKTALGSWEAVHGSYVSSLWPGMASSPAGQELHVLLHEDPIPNLYLTDVMTLPLAAFGAVSLFLLLAGWRSRRRIYTALFLSSAQVVVYLAYRDVFGAINDVTT